MADGYFERGEIYTIRMDRGVGSEEGAFRPGVIVSSDVGNKTSPCVIVAYLTTQYRSQSHVIETMATGRQSRILTDQLCTVSKTRLGKLLGELSSYELRKLDDALETVLDLGYVDEETEKEIETLKNEKASLQTDIEILKAQLATKDEEKKDELLSLRVESEMWQKLYMKALDQVVNMKLGADVAIRVERKTPAVVEVPRIIPEPVVVKPEPPVVTETAPEPDKVDINHCTQTALRKRGFSLAMSRLIVSYRPFENVPDLKRVPGMKANFYRIVESKLCCTPMQIEPEKVAMPKQEPDPGYEVTEEQPKPKEKPEWDGVKVNVNTVATAAELMRRTGLSVRPAQAVMKYRKEHGPFETLEDLLKVDGFGKIAMKRYGHMLEV